MKKIFYLFSMTMLTQTAHCGIPCDIFDPDHEKFHNSIKTISLLVNEYHDKDMAPLYAALRKNDAAIQEAHTTITTCKQANYEICIAIGKIKDDRPKENRQTLQSCACAHNDKAPILKSRL
jgi:hypothetical protein